jgi:alkanesulfonate monooxygenase SsuD/methylene tetrahydromethanopterin reductase-like flavin-dependent oxidoreductase (luciferase family)
VRFLLEPEDADVLDAARAAEAHGLDGVYLAPTPSLPAPLVTAAAIASAVDGILIAAEVPLGDRHPVELAEEAAVVDLAAAGRLVLVVRPAGAGFEEALDLLRIAFAARPFAHRGERWTVPAGLPQNLHAPALARVTPAPFQPRLEVWTAGCSAATAVRRGLGHVAGAGEVPALDGGPASIGAPRARREAWTDTVALLDRLRAGREAFGQDWAVVRAPASAARAIAAEVRPRVQLSELPPGLEAHWAQGG